MPSLERGRMSMSMSLISRRSPRLRPDGWRMPGSWKSCRRSPNSSSDTIQTTLHRHFTPLRRRTRADYPPQGGIFTISGCIPRLFEGFQMIYIHSTGGRISRILVFSLTFHIANPLSGVESHLTVQYPDSPRPPSPAALVDHHSGFCLGPFCAPKGGWMPVHSSHS